MSLSKKIAYNTLIQVIGKAASVILGLLAIAFITRYLGQSGFGQYTTIITFLSFFAIITDFGLTLVTAQMIGSGQENEEKVLNNLFSLRLVSALLFIGAAPLVVILFPYDGAIKIGVLIASLSFIFPALNQILVGLFQKNLKMEAVSLADAISRAVLLIGTIIAIRANWGINGILWAAVLAAFTSFLIHLIFSRRFFKLKLEIDWLIWKKILHKTWPLALTIAFNLIYLKADTLILSLMKSSAEVGLYGAAYKIIDVLTALPFMFAGIILPLLSADISNHNLERFKKIMQKSFDVLAVVALPLVFGVQFVSDPLMVFIAGADFVSAGLILRILIFALAAIFIGCIFSHAIIALDKQKKVIGAYAFVGLSSLLAYLFLIPRYSYFGAASVTIYSEVAIAIFSIYYTWRYSRFLPSLKVFGKSLLASLIMSLALYLSPKTWGSSLPLFLTEILGASIIYFIALFILGGIHQDDLKTFYRRRS